MNKQDIYVVIDSKETREKAQQILENSGEVIKHLSSLYVTYKELLHLIFDDTNQEWCVEPNWHKVASKLMIDIFQLETLLKQKELTFPRVMMVGKHGCIRKKETVIGMWNNSYLVREKTTGYIIDFPCASEIEPPKPSPIDEVIAFAESKGVVITGGLSMYKSLVDLTEESGTYAISSDQNYLPEPQFVLPEKWAVKKTEENADVIGMWANQIFPGHFGKLSNVYLHRNFDDLYTNPYLENGFTEITFDQFKKHVLKEN